MRVRVKLPKIGMTMEEATVVRFCKQPGEAFSKGDPLYEIETEKISQQVEATGDGVMVEHAVPEGSDVRVGEPVCVVETHDVPGVRGSSPAGQPHDLPGVRGSSPAGQPHDLPGVRGSSPAGQQGRPR